MEWPDFIELVQDGEPVRAGTPNRPLRQLEQRTNYLWQVLQSTAAGSALFARRVPVEAATVVGSPVYYDAAAGRFRRALARVSADLSSGLLMTDASAHVWGVVYHKHHSEVADLLLFGYAELNIAAASNGDTQAGLYYLSGSQEGRLTRQRPAVSVPVLRHDGQGHVFVLPSLVDLLERHVHYRFELVAKTAGAHNQPTFPDPHAITSPDPDLPGWLPANHAVFGGLAPAGAKFGYNLNKHPALKSVWPPVPESSAYLEWETGVIGNLGTSGVPLGVNGLCIIDRNGIWWMSDCHGSVPWPTNYDHTATDPPDWDGSCPRPERKRVWLYFTRPNFSNEASVVRSLKSVHNRLFVRCAGGAPGSTGDLEVGLDLSWSTTPNATGYQVLKSFDVNDGQFQQGPVVEGIYALSSNIALVGAETETRIIGGTPRVLYKGPVGLQVSSQASRELDVQLVRLDGVEEHYFQDTMYLGFPPADQSAIRCKLYIPGDLDLPNPQLTLRFLVLGRAAGTLPQLQFSGRRLPRSTGLSSPQSLPGSGSEFTITCNTQGVLTTANQYVEAASQPFAVQAGELILFTVRRLATDGYPAEVGVIHQVGIVSAGP